jgi:hypothetical protein
VDDKTNETAERPARNVADCKKAHRKGWMPAKVFGIVVAAVVGLGLIGALAGVRRVLASTGTR